MITFNQHPVAWAMLLYELSDAHEHLGALVNQMAESGGIDIEDYQIQLGHVFAHLNRAWNCKDDPDFDTSGKRVSHYPEDLRPVG